MDDDLSTIPQNKYPIRTYILNGSGEIVDSFGGSGGAVTIADGADQALGFTTDAVVAAGATGTVSAKLRRLTTDLATAVASLSILDDWDDGSDNLKAVGNVAAAATDTGNPLKVGGVFSTTLPTLTDGQRGNNQLGNRGSLHVEIFGTNSTTGAAASASGADGVSNTTAGINMYVFPRIFNGTTWDRPVSIITGTNSTGTGISAVGLLAQYDDTSPTTITENQFGNLRMSTDRMLYTERHYSLTRVTADTQVKGSAGFVHAVSIAPVTATPTAGLFTLYDSLTETGTILYSEWIFATTPGHTVILDTPAGTGIFAAFDGSLANVQASVSWR